MSLILPSIGGGIVASPTAPAYSNSYSVDFDGSDDYMSASVTELNGSSVMSASIWFRFEGSLGGATNIIMSSVASGTTSGWYLWLKSATSIQYGIAGGTAKDYTMSAISNGTWYHLAVVHDGTNNATLYLDGSSLGTQAVSALPASFGDVFNLGRWAGNSYYYNGYADEVSLFDSALSASDITSIYNSGVPADISSLNPVGWWRMGDNDGGTGTTITDQGSGGNDGTLTNGPTFSTDVPLAPLVLPSITNSYALSFDGSNDYVDTGIPTDLQGSATMSLSFWFKSDTSGVGPSIGCRSGSANQWGFLRAGSLNYVQIMTGSNGKYFSYSSPSDTNYHHYVITFNAGTIEFFLDGSPVSVSFTNSGNGIAATLHSDSVSFDIGRNQSFYSDGLMDEVSLFDKVLSQREITAMYNSGTPNDISSLNPVGWYRNGDNDGGTGTTITDQGSAGNNGTLTNGPTFSTTVP
jgi:hypothetical protein